MVEPTPKEKRRSQAIDAAVTRTAPILAGSVVGAVAAWAAPCSADNEFFSVTAQVLPVLLLALVIELRISGTSRRYFKEVGRLPNAIELVGRGGAGLMTVALLVGEYQCARAITNSSDSANPWAPALGLGWGFVTVAIAASLGARPRLIPTVEARPRPDKNNQFIVQIGASNEFGDKDVSPVMNLLIPLGAKIYVSDQFGHVDPTKEIELLQTREQVPPGTAAEDWKYLFGRPLVSAGDAFVQHYVIILDDFEEARVVLRFDHVEFKRGRVQTQISLP